jgi:inner membrane protein
MPSPVGHSLIGYILYRGTNGSLKVHQWKLLALYLFAANAADLDFIPGFIIGDPNRYHHGISHSIGLALVFALAFSFLPFLQKRYSFKRNFSIFFFLYFSHIGLDYLSTDTGFPYGEPVLWPLSHEYYIASFAFLPDITRAPSGTNTEVFLSLFSLHNFWAVNIELLIMLPILVIQVLKGRIKPFLPMKG